MLPTDIKLHKRTAILELSYDDGGIYTLPAEFLRVHSPSAEVRGHGVGQEVLQVGKIDVKIDTIETVGNYAISLHFDDGHNTGIYTWEYLRELGLHQAEMWENYLHRLQQAGARREVLPTDTQVVNIVDFNKK
jgi:DUF971 family protein